MISKYNELLDEFSEQSHDFEISIIGDLLLDVNRYKSKPLLDVLSVVSDYKTAVKKGTGY